MLATKDSSMVSAVPEEWAALQDVGALFYQRGWSVGTSSNYSVVLERNPLRLLITASGKDKRCLRADDYVVVGDDGKPVAQSSGRPGSGKPSAETMLHVVTARDPAVGAVLHTHSVWSTLLSERYGDSGAVVIEGFEMLKGLAGVNTHDCSVRIEIFENTQDIASLSRVIAGRFADADNPLRFGFLLRRHGLYTWGQDLNEARRHVEILEFLFEVLGRQLQINAGNAS